MSDPLSALRDDYDKTWERLSRLESENAALKKMIGEWATQIEKDCAGCHGAGWYSDTTAKGEQIQAECPWKSHSIAAKMLEAAK